MEKNSRLRHSEDLASENSLSAREQTASASSAAEFDSPEALLRHDAARTPLPPDLAARLSESLEDEPAPPRAPWWRRLLGGGS